VSECSIRKHSVFESDRGSDSRSFLLSIAGESAKFKIRYRDASAQTAAFKFVDANHNTMHTVSGLELGTSYVFSVLAFNQMGASEYVNSMLKASTSSKFPHIYRLDKRAIRFVLS